MVVLPRQDKQSQPQTERTMVFTCPKCGIKTTLILDIPSRYQTIDIGVEDFCRCQG